MTWSFADLKKRDEVVVVHPLGRDAAKSSCIGRRNRRDEREEVGLRKVPSPTRDSTERHFFRFPVSLFPVSLFPVSLFQKFILKQFFSFHFFCVISLKPVGDNFSILSNLLYIQKNLAKIIVDVQKHG